MKMWKPAALVVMACAAVPALAADNCTGEIAGNDAMQYDKATMSVPASCKQYTVKLTHPGKMPKTAMGHNWVLTKTSDMQAVATDGIPAGLNNNYIKPSDPRVIAHTKVIGGGESDSVTFDVSKLKAGDAYSYFCSFPGHSAIMKGTLTVAAK